MGQLTESAVDEVALDGQYLPLCRGEVRNLEHGPEPDVLPAMHGSSGAIADRADSAGRSCALASQRQRRDCGQVGRQHESGHVSDTSAAAGGHIAAGRGRACGWRVTDPARRALTRLKGLFPRDARPSPQAGPRDLPCLRTAVWPAPPRAGTGPGGDAASDLLRHCPAAR